jgi:hypothetical protein
MACEPNSLGEQVRDLDLVVDDEDPHREVSLSRPSNRPTSVVTATSIGDSPFHVDPGPQDVLRGRYAAQWSLLERQVGSILPATSPDRIARAGESGIKVATGA